MKTALELLKAGYEILKDRSRWTTYAYARDKHGKIVSPENPNAHCFCSSGVLKYLNKDRFGMDYGSAYNILDFAASQSAPYAVSSIIEINDIGGYEATLAMWRRAIELAQAKEM